MIVVKKPVLLREEKHYTKKRIKVILLVAILTSKDTIW